MVQKDNQTPMGTSSLTIEPYKKMSLSSRPQPMPASINAASCYQPKSSTRLTSSSEYRNLRHVVPSLRRQRDIGKVEVVTEAARYIDHLHKTLIDRFILCGIPDSLKEILGTSDATELGTKHIMKLVAKMAEAQNHRGNERTLADQRRQAAPAPVARGAIDASNQAARGHQLAQNNKAAPANLRIRHRRRQRLSRAPQRNHPPHSQQQLQAAAATATTNTSCHLHHHRRHSSLVRPMQRRRPAIGSQLFMRAGSRFCARPKSVPAIPKRADGG